MSIDTGDRLVEYKFKERERIGSYMYDHQDDYVKRSRYEEVQKQNRELTDKVKDLVCEVSAKCEVIDYAKSIIKSLLDNSDEYAEQRARDFLME